MAVWNMINLSDIHPDRFDAEYFRKDYQDTLTILKKTGTTYSFGRLFKYINRGSQPLYHKDGTIKALRSVNIGFMNFNETRQEYVTQQFLKSNNRGKVEKDDVLITSTGVGTLGRASIWYKEEKAYCDGHITILRNSYVDPYLITAFLNSKFGLAQFDQNYRGSSGQIEIYPYDISKFIIPECLFPFQKEIGDYLREAFQLKSQSELLFKQATDDLELKLGLDNSEIDNLPNKYISTFNEIVLGKRLDPEYFNPRSKKIVEKIRNFEHTTVSKNYNIKNGFPWNSNKFLEDNSGEPVIRIRDVKPTYIDNKKLTSIDKEYSKSISFEKAKTGDIVIGMDGLKYFYASILEDDCMVNQRVCHLYAKECALVSPEYLTFIINSKIGQAQIMRDMTIATTVGHITNLNVAKLIIPIVSDEFHNNITDLVRKSIEADKQSKELLAEAKNRVEQLIEEAI